MPNGNGEFAICDKGIDMENCNFQLLPLIFPALKEFLILLGNTSSSSRMFGPQNQLQTCKNSNFDMLLHWYG